MGIGTYLLWILQGGFFNGTTKPVTVDFKLNQMSRKHMCLSSIQISSEVEGSIQKRYGKCNFISCIMKVLISLTLLHQTGALSYEITYGTNTQLEDRVPPDIDKT